MGEPPQHRTNPIQRSVDRRDFWARAFASRLWLYYRTDPDRDAYVELHAMRDHLHEQ